MSVELAKMSTTEPDRKFSKNFLMAMVFDAGAENSGLGGLLGNRLTPERAARFAARRINKMNKAGLSTYTYMSEMGSEIICLIGGA